MPDLKRYAIFISHAWRYNAEYYRLEKMLNEAPLFKWANYSVPEHDPKIDPDTAAGKKTLMEALKKQIRPVNCVLIISGMYVPYSYWIQAEIDFANLIDKPIIGIKPWGSEQIPLAVQEAAKIMVGWNTSPIIEAIRRYAL